MKRCPECRRDYYDDTLMYCLDDGNALLEGPSTVQNQEDLPESPTAVFPGSTPKGLVGESSGSPPGSSIRHPANRARTSSRAIYLAGAALVIFLLGVFLIYRWLTPAVGEIDSVAVLPFENASGNAELDYLSDGVSESLIDRLSQLPQLKVIARSSSFQYRGNSDPREVANALGVDAVITGRVVPIGNSVNIRVELVDARNNKHLWGENFVRPLSDVQALQTDISRQIAEILRIRLSGMQVDRVAGGGTTNQEAYELFLRGRFFFHKAGAPENFRKAAEYLEKAISVDPNFALAHTVLADAYGFGGFPPHLSRPQRESLLGEITQRAIELDPQLADAHGSMAAYRRRTWKWEEAKASSLRAIELNPNLAHAVNGYAMYLTLMGQHDAAIENALRARELDPISLVINTNLGNIYMRTGRHDEAIEVLQKTIDFGEPAMFARRSLGSAYVIRGMHDQALAQYEEALRISGNSQGIKALIGFLHARAGRRELAESIAREINVSTGAAPPEFALLLDILGRRDEAFEVLEANLNNRSPGLPLVVTEPIFKPLSDDVRFRSLLGKIGLPG